MKPKKTRKPKKNKKTRLQDPWNQKTQKKTQDCKTHESSNLGTLGSDILFFFVFFGFLGFLGFPCPGHRYRPKMHKQHHYTPGLSFIWCLMDWAPKQKTVETALKKHCPGLKIEGGNQLQHGLLILFNVPGCACITLREYDIHCLGCPCAQLL